MPKVGDKVKVLRNISKYRGKEGTIQAASKMFMFTKDEESPCWHVELKSGERMLLLRHEFEVIE